MLRCLFWSVSKQEFLILCLKNICGIHHGDWWDEIQCFHSDHSQDSYPWQLHQIMEKMWNSSYELAGSIVNSFAIKAWRESWLIVVVFISWNLNFSMFRLSNKSERYAKPNWTWHFLKLQAVLFPHIPGIKLLLPSLPSVCLIPFDSQQTSVWSSRILFLASSSSHGMVNNLEFIALLLT